MTMLKGIKRIRPGMRLTAQTVRDVYNATRANTPQPGQANTAREGWSQPIVRQRDYVFKPTEENIDPFVHDQFKAEEAYEQQKIIVLADEYFSVTVGNDGDIQWTDSPIVADASLSTPYALPHGTESKLYVEYYNAVGLDPAYVQCVLLTPDEDGVYSPAGDHNDVIAVFTTDERGAITEWEQVYEGFTVTLDPAEPALIGVQLRGGVWQVFEEDHSTSVYPPVDANWDPLADNSHDRMFSRPYEGEGVLWALLKNTTPARALEIVQLDIGVDPTWGIDQQYLKLVTVNVTRADPEDEESSIVSIDLLQHHQGGIHTEIAAPVSGACASMSVGAYGGVSAGLVDFDVLNHETNAAILDADTTANTIIVKEGYSGIYRINIQCLANDVTTGVASAFLVVRQDTVDTECNWGFGAADYWTGASSASIDLFVDASEGNVTFDVYINSIVNMSVDKVRFDMALVQLCSFAT